MVLEQLITGAHLFKALSGQPDVAVLQDSVIQKTDSSAIEIYDDTIRVIDDPQIILKLNSEIKTGNRFNTSVPFNRTETTLQLGDNSVGFTHDRKETNDVGRLSFANKNVGFNFYKVGDGTRNDVFYTELWKTLDLGDKSLLLDGGMGHGKTTVPQYFGYVKLSDKTSAAEVQFFNTGDKLFNFNESFYLYGAHDFGKVYLGAGKTPSKYVGVAGIKGFEDFGHLAYMLYTPDKSGKTNGSWEAKILNSYSDASEGFFNKDFFDYVGEIFAMDPFFMPNFTKAPKGSIGSKITLKGNDSETEIEALVGSNNKILAISVGLNNLSKNGKNNTNLVAEINKSFKLFEDFSGYVEARYNARTGEVQGYTVIKYNINLK